MNALIVARTIMNDGRRCIGAIGENGDSLRLLDVNGNHHDTNAPYQPGQMWDLITSPAEERILPHTEDIKIRTSRHIETLSEPRSYILERITPWEGRVDSLFDGFLQRTGRDSCYIAERTGVPQISTWFWLPDRELTLCSDTEKHFAYTPNHRDYRLVYVGENPPRGSLPGIIPAGTLTRVSLATWWRPRDAEPDFELRCYLQLSGWYS